MIWHQIQMPKLEKRDLNVIFLDLAYAFGSVPHEFIWTIFKYFTVPDTITTLVKPYFQDLQFFFSTPAFTTSQQCLEVGIMAGCNVPPFTFTMSKEIIIQASKSVVGGQRLSYCLCVPPLRADMGDITILTTTV